jgi:glycerol kinase
VQLVLALDAGTTSVRALAFDDRLRVVDVAQEPLTQHFPAPGWVEHEPTEIARLSVAALGALARRARDRGDLVRCVGVTNQRETTIAFDRASGEGPRAIVWQDRRTAEHCEALGAGGHGAAVRERTGLVLDPYFSGTKMRWLIDHGALKEMSAPSLATVDTYLVWALTGGPSGGAYVTEPSNASRTMLMDLSTRQWSTEMSDLLGVPLAYLATIGPSAGELGVVAATVDPTLAGTPITGVLGDQQAALFGQACVIPGMIKATYGTGSFLLANTGPTPPTPIAGLISTVAWDFGRVGPVHYALEGSAFTAGAAIQWLRDELGLIARAEEVGPLAASVPDAGGVSFVPALSGLGSPYWRADARGAFFGLTRGTTRAHLARAVLDAICYQARAITDAFRDGGVSPVELRADGGVAAVDDLLRLQATSSRVDVCRGDSLEATARGAAAAAGLAAGLWPSVEAVADTWRESFRAAPVDPTGADLGYAAWRRAVERS